MNYWLRLFRDCDCPEDYTFEDLREIKQKAEEAGEELLRRKVDTFRELKMINILESREDPGSCTMEDLEAIREYAETLSNEAYVRIARLLIEEKKDPNSVYTMTREEALDFLQKNTWFPIKGITKQEADDGLASARRMQPKIKYFDREYPRLEKTEKGDWIDLRSRERIELKAGGHYMIPLGVAIELPAGYEAIVAPRSSAFRRYGVLQTNSIGIIDETYCGDSDEWKLSVYATRDAVIEKYDRICQFRLIEHQPAVSFEEVESLGNDSRGGFGSTGK